jgi:ribonuclease D
MATYIYKGDLPNDFNLEGDIAIDTETMGLNLHRDRLCMVQFSNGNGDAYLVIFEKDTYLAPNLRKLLQDPKRQYIFHFARFDVAVIEKHLGVVFHNIFCTKIASKLVRTYTDSHGLKDLCRELLAVNLSKQQQSSDWGSSELTIDQREYAARDVLFLHDLRDKLTIMLKREDRLDLFLKISNFLPIRAKLDMMGWSEVDIFSHS